MIVVSDTTPLNYLGFTGQADLLSQLYQRVIIPRQSTRNHSDNELIHKIEKEEFDTSEMRLKELRAEEVWQAILAA